MTLHAIQELITQYWYVSIPLVLALSYGLYRLTKFVLARGLFFVAIRTETVYDDLIVDNLRPFRLAWLVPLILVNAFSFLAGDWAEWVSDIALFLVIVVCADLVISLLSGLNAIYKQRPTYTGASVAAYIDLIKVFVIVAGIVLALSFFTDTPPITLLSGVGAWLAVLLLIFRDTILNFVASIQISSQDLVREGDWIEVPSYEANGTVVGVTLNSISVKNSDNTITIIPTYKMVEVAYRNYRGIEESGGRRIKLSLTFDLNSVSFCDREMLAAAGMSSLVADYSGEQISRLDECDLGDAAANELPLDGPQITNVQLFMKYAEAYLRGRKDLRQRRFPFVIRVSQPTSDGLPLEIYVFTRKTSWADYEATKGDILMRLVAATPYFGLKVFQNT